MFKKIKLWWKLRRPVNTYESFPEPTSYTREQLENARRLGHADGRREGLAIARKQATRSLKEILKSQNRV